MSNISPFDIAAETYDKDFTQSHIGRLQRQRVWQVLTPVLQSYNRPLNILEINCGTGEDALQLAKLGHKVIATDASEKMIQTARDKSAGANFKTDQLSFIKCSYARLPDYEFEKSFDLVISNFGGLNCADKTAITNLGNHLSRMVTTDGKLLLVVMSKCCLWELAYYSLKGKFSTAFRRWKRSVRFNVNEHIMRIFYYSPATLVNLFKPAFSLLTKQPVGLFIPPSYLESAFSKRLHVLQLLNRWEKRCSFPALSFLADHYCVILNKTNAK